MEIKFRNLKYSLKCLLILIKSKPIYLIISIIDIISTVLSYIIPISIVDKIVSGFEEGKTFKELIIIVLFNVLIILVFQLINQIVSYFKFFIKSQFSLTFQIMLFKKLQMIDYEFHQNAYFLDNYTRALDGGADKVCSLAEGQMSIICQLITSFSVLAIIFTISYYAVGYAILAAILFMIVRRKSGIINFDRLTDDRPYARLEWSIARVFYVKDAIPVMKTTSINDVMLEEHLDLTNSRIKVYDKHIKKKTVYDTIGNVLLATTYPVILLLVAINVVKSKNISTLSSLTVAALLISNCINNLIVLLTDMQINALEAKVSFDVLEMDSKIEARGGVDTPNNFKSLEVNNISFAYEKDHNVISNVSFSINKGEKVAIVGSNGAGKTTLVKLLLRLYDVDNGYIAYNEINYKDLDPKKLRKKLGAVFQNPEVYSVSVGENILLRRIETKEDREVVVNALKFADIYDYVMSLPQGIDTIVTREFDREGAVFSGGQMQKIAVARGYAQNYDVLLLDEPSSKLDPIAETKMYKNMLKMGENRTLLFISHRLSATCNCDRILLFEHGKIVEEGTHEELMKIENGRYREMFTSQSEKYLDEVK